MPKKNKNPDPDRLSLSKKDILEFCDGVLKKWHKNPAKHTNHIFAMNAVKASIIWTDEESIRAIWSEIVKWTFELLYENALAQGKEENVNWSKTLEKLKKTK